MRDGAPTLVILAGPPAVGKMTIGQALARQTGMPLFFNHQIIDVVTDYLPFGTAEFEAVVQPFYENLLSSCAAAGSDLVITWGWRFDVEEDTRRVEDYTQPFLEQGGRACVAELVAPIEVRLERNQTPNRRAHKKTDWATEEWLRELESRHRYSSDGAFPLDLAHLALDVTTRTAEESAEHIAAHFGLATAPRSD